MSRFKLSFGVVVVAALALAAFAASASAAPTLSQEHCTTETGATEASAKYTTNACTTESGTGTFKWKKTTGATTLEPMLTEAFMLKSTNGGINFTIKCTGLEGTGTSTPGATSIVGSGITLTYTGCTVEEPAGRSCVVRSSTDAVGSGKIMTNSLKSTLVGIEPPTEAAHFTITYTPTTSTVFTTIVVENCTTAALNGSKEVTGEAMATLNTVGRVQEFTSTSGSTLKFGGQTATFTGKSELTTPSGAAVRVVTP